VTFRPAPVPPGAAPAIEARLEPDAIGLAQDTVIGLANVGPALTLGLTLAGLAAASAYGSAPMIALCAAPMLVIANSYRRLNLWNANCGASFEWVGRAINPYLGFQTGWLMIAANIFGTIAAVVVLAPSVLAVFGAAATSTWPNIAIATAVLLVMLIVAIAGIRPTAHVQVSMAAIEYAILIGFAVLGLTAVLGHHAGTYPITNGWFSTSGIGGKGNLASGLLIAVFMFAGWGATVYVNEEVKHRRENPGLQGVVSPARLQANSSSVLVYVAQALAGPGWAKVMAVGLALSVSASVGVGVVALARIIYGMAVHRVLPPVLGNVSPRFSTPLVASVITGMILIAATWLYLLSGSIATLFGTLISVDGLLYTGFYILTALATIFYYRRRILSNAWDALLVGLLPLGAAGFLGWIIVRSLQGAPGSERWSLAGIVAAGLLVMATPGSSWDPRSSRPHGKAREGAAMNAPARPVPAGQHDVMTCLACGMTGPSPDRPCRPGWDHRVSPPEAGCPGCSRLTAVCARRPCQARRSRFRWQLTGLRLRRAWRRLRPRPGPSCCGTPGQCSR
jgi:amino acid transporter